MTHNNVYLLRYLLIEENQGISGTVRYARVHNTAHSTGIIIILSKSIILILIQFKPVITQGHRILDTIGKR